MQAAIRGARDRPNAVLLVLRKLLATEQMTEQYEVFNEKKVLINEGETHLIFVDMKSKRIKSAPALLLDNLKPYF